MKTKEFNTIRRLAILALVVATSILLYRCVIDTFDMKLRIVNQTADTIFVGPLKSGKSFKSHPVQLDSIKRDTLWKYMEWVNPFDSLDGPPPTLGSWERYINEKCEDSTLTVFIFEKSLLKSVSPDSLVSNQIYSKKYSYKVKDLEKLNWRVEYK